MKNFRKKAAPAIVLLAGASMSLAGVTFAWFNQNTNANVSKINVGVVDASGGVAVSDKADGTYKTSLDFNDVEGSEGAEKHTFGQLDPISTNGALNSTNDMFKFYHGILSEEDTSCITSESISSGYQTFDLFFENVSGNNRYVYFDYDELYGYTHASKYSSLMKEIFGSDIASQYSLRLGFINLGTSSGKSDTKTPESTDHIIIEPDWHNHTSVASAALNEQGQYIQDTTYALVGSFGDDTPIRPSKDTVDASKMEEQVAYKVSDCNFNEDLGRPLFTIKQGYTQIRVVMWLEGQDIDNDNSVSGKPFSFNLKFNTKVVDTAVKDAKTAAKGELKTFREAVNGSGETTIATAGDTSIDAKASVVDVKVALAAAKADIQKLRDARSTALDALNTYGTLFITGDSADGHGDRNTTYITKKNEAVANVNAATTVGDIQTACNNGKVEIDTIYLATAKISAKATLSDYGTAPAEDPKLTAFNTAKTNGNTAIDSATTLQGVEDALNAAEAAINAIIAPAA